MTGLILSTFLVPTFYTITGLGDCGKEWYAVYDIPNKVIVTCQPDNKYVMAHEEGHAVWFQLLTDQQRSQYKKIYQKRKYVTVNGKKNVEEDFADVYTMVKLGYSQKGYQLRIRTIKNFSLFK